MILVLFGTSSHDFSRLAKAEECYARNCDEEIIAQIGNMKYCPKGIKCFDFLPRKELLDLIRQAEIIITQGGFGSIMDCLDFDKKVVAVPRQQLLGECQHGGLGQAELVRQLDEQGRLVGVFDTGDLPLAIERARRLKTIEKSEPQIPHLVNEFVKSVIC